MELIVKKQTDPAFRIMTPVDIASTTRYELFTPETVKDVNDEDVTIPKSIGFYSLSELNAEKARLETMLASIEEKITAIQAQIDSEI